MKAEENMSETLNPTIFMIEPKDYTFPKHIKGNNMKSMTIVAVDDEEISLMCLEAYFFIELKSPLIEFPHIKLHSFKAFIFCIIKKAQS